MNINLSMPEPFAQRLKEMAEESGLTVSETVRGMIQRESGKRVALPALEDWRTVDVGTGDQGCTGTAGKKRSVAGLPLHRDGDEWDWQWMLLDEHGGISLDEGDIDPAVAARWMRRATIALFFQQGDS